MTTRAEVWTAVSLTCISTAVFLLSMDFVTRLGEQMSQAAY